MKKLLLISLSLSSLIASGCRTTGGQDTSAAAGAGDNAPVLSCSAMLNESNQHTVKLSVQGKKLTVEQSSLNGLFAPIEYKLEPVNLFAAPAGEARFSCAEGQLVIKVWEQFARVGGSYFKMSGGTTPQPVEPAQPAPVSCKQMIDENNQHTAELTVADGKLTIMQSSINGDWAPQRHTLTKVQLTVAPVGEPRFACSAGETAIMVWEQFARVGASYYQLGSETAGGDAGSNNSCTQMLDESNQHTAKLTLQGNKLTIMESSLNGLHAPKTYALQQALIIAPPAGIARYSCKIGQKQIMVWQTLARVGNQYFSLNAVD